MATFQSFQPRAGGFLVSESNGNRSRENIIVISGQNLPTGTVLGLITASGKYTAYAPGASDGSQNAAGVLWDVTDAMAGDAKAAAIVRDAEVNSGELVWPAGFTNTQILAGLTSLAAKEIIVRAAL